MNYISYEFNNGTGAKVWCKSRSGKRRNPDPDRVERNHKKKERTTEIGNQFDKEQVQNPNPNREIGKESNRTQHETLTLERVKG
jgi:hypothetical protein